MAVEHCPSGQKRLTISPVADGNAALGGKGEIMVLELNRFESFLAQKAENAELCDFTAPEWQGQNDIEIRAEAIRALLLGLPVKLFKSTEERIVGLMGPGLRVGDRAKAIAEPGLQILQARITGTLDLDHASRGNGDPLPHLCLLACRFDNPIILDHARLKGLSLAGSRLTHICAHHAVIEGSVDLSGIHSSEEDVKTGMGGKGQCWVDFHGADIGAAFYADGAELRAPEVRSEEILLVEPQRYALDLGHTEIAGSVVIWRGFSADGGISIELARIDGHVRGLALHAIKGEGAAISARGANIRGDFDLRPRKDGNAETQISMIDGDTDISSVKIAGVLAMGGVQLKGRLFAQSAEIGGGVFLNASNGKKDGKAQTFLFEAKEEVSFSGAKITGSLEMSGAKLEGRLFAQNAEISGGVFLQAESGVKNGKEETFPFTVKEVVWLASARITGQLSMVGARLYGGLHAQGVNIGGSAVLRAVDGKKNGREETFLFTAEKDISLFGAEIGGQLNMRGAQLSGALSAESIQVTGSAFLSSYHGRMSEKRKVFKFISRHVNLWGARIGQGLDMQGAKLKSGVALANVKVGGSILYRTLPDWFGYGKRGSYFELVIASFLMTFICCSVGTNFVTMADKGMSRAEARIWGAILPPKSVMVLDRGTVDTRDIAFSSSPKMILAPGETPCGDQIDPFIYATDLFVPLVDLHQEYRCSISSAPQARPWRIAFMLFEILGWGLVSLVLFIIASIAVSGPGTGASRE